MSNCKDYFRKKELDKWEKTKQDRIYRLLVGKCLDGKADDCLPNFNFSILKKEQIENNIQAACGWERTSNGFDYRNNFHFDESGNYIVFDSYSVFKSNNKFESDGSEISNDFIKNNSRMLNSIMKIYQVYDMLSQKFESDVKQAQDTMDNRLQHLGGISRIRVKAYLDYGHTNRYFNIYGELGKQLLIKWLNKLSDTSKSMDELLVNFDNDMNIANEYYKAQHLDKKYLYTWKLEYVLLVELMNYSSRGEVFRRMYIDMKENKSKNKQKTK